MSPEPPSTKRRTVDRAFPSSFAVMPSRVSVVRLPFELKMINRRESQLTVTSSG